MIKKEISKDTQLAPGSIVEIKFDFLPGDWIYWRATQSAYLIDAAKRKYTNFEYIGDTITTESIFIKFKVSDQIQVTMQQAGVTGVIIAAAILGGSIFVYFAFDKIYLITEELTNSPGGQLALAGMGSIGIGLLIVAIIFLLPKLRT